MNEFNLYSQGRRTPGILVQILDLPFYPMGDVSGMKWRSVNGACRVRLIFMLRVLRRVRERELKLRGIGIDDDKSSEKTPVSRHQGGADWRGHAD
jgi:hypothetical protein